MNQQVDRQVADVIGDYTGHARTVLEYCMTVDRLVHEAKSPGFGVQNWGALAELVAVDEFERVGAFKEVMDWPAYTDFLTTWATSSTWRCSFRRLTEAADLIFLELEEHSAVGDFTSVVNSLSVYRFNDTGQITRIDLYLQMELPDPELLKSFEGVDP
ncbi:MULTISPECIES: hypothetical protein [unclassified Mycobacterium]|uniref:hypothetical protein n=1 Tax=unclassified Mycobacterium TaxID=2642494 RepID=UPI002742625E|nr:MULTISPECIES: hypothetical protein [unclassified Mycobacterium]MDP7705648.1 hypothetical protein [Mycobacterium sp. TY815]MDP7725109.1 hypothetical protein [Mycobacterium sp. TY814]